MGPGHGTRIDPNRWQAYAPIRFEHHDGSHPLAWLIFALLLIVLVLLIVHLVQGLTRRHHRPWMGPRGTFTAPWPGRQFMVDTPHLEEPLAILRLRYARGEISRDEFVQASTDLGAPPGAEPAPPPA